MASVPSDIIRAAGVVCLRDNPAQVDGSRASLEVLLVHRTRLRDWSLPKGKLALGEHVAVAAVRETEEETGYRVTLGVPLKTQRYEVGGRPKEVAYWLARVVGQSQWSPDEEVDEVRWVGVDEARDLLTYPRDSDLVRSAVKKARRGTSPLIVLRHGQAVKRAEFARLSEVRQPDSLRPLSRVGERQSEDLVPVLAAFGISSVHSSPSTRCLDTVAPYATAIGCDVVDEPLLSEEGFASSRKAAMRRVTELLSDPAPRVICTHRPVIPALFEQLRRHLGPLGVEPDLPAGGFVVVHRDFGSASPTAVATERHAP